MTDPHSMGTAARPVNATDGPRAVAPYLDVRAMIEGARPGVVDLHERYVNPAFASVLRTIGFDQRWARGQGAYLWDDTGRRYIDCLGGYAVFAGGRNHPVIRDALRQTMEMDLPNLPGVGVFAAGGLLARELTLIAPGSDGVKPGELDTVFFASGGGEAVDAAIKFARQATSRERIVHCVRSYHGLTIGSLAVTANPEFREGFGQLMPGTAEVPFNDLAALEAELSRRDVAAFIVEPIQGKGVNIPSAEYLGEASRLCRKYGVLLICDEIQAGMGRTGRWWACEHFGAGSGGPGGWLPDIMVVGKALSGGYVPTSAVVLKRWVHSKTFDGMAKAAKMQNTFSMNDLSMVAGLASIHVMRQERLVENAASVGAYLRDGLKAALAGMEMVSDVRGLGLMIAVEFARPAGLARRLSWDAVHKIDANLFCQSVIIPLMRDHGVLTQVAGYKLDNIKLIPPLVLSRADADEVIAGFKATVGAVHRGAGPMWIVPRLGAAALRRFVPGGGGGGNSGGGKAEAAAR